MVSSCGGLFSRMALWMGMVCLLYPELLIGNIACSTSRCVRMGNDPYYVEIYGSIHVRSEGYTCMQTCSLHFRLTSTRSYLEC